MHVRVNIEACGGPEATGTARPSPGKSFYGGRRASPMLELRQHTFASCFPRQNGSRTMCLRVTRLQ